MYSVPCRAIPFFIFTFHTINNYVRSYVTFSFLRILLDRSYIMGEKKVEDYSSCLDSMEFVGTEIKSEKDGVGGGGWFQ